MLESAMQKNKVGLLGGRHEGVLSRKGLTEKVTCRQKQPRGEGRGLLDPGGTGPGRGNSKCKALWAEVQPGGQWLEHSSKE